ncbi:MAG: TonB-dependent receptor [Flavobacteriaceae bacterium]|jgi:outer membrane cobalamin receptor|nr:TonB-dependent receptor [Flavobacteriaceae bacterium]
MRQIYFTILLLLCFGICAVKAQIPTEQPQDSTRKVQLDGVVVSGNRPGTVLSSANSLKTETITQTGLKKMACCTLSESFENSASVSVGFTDAVSGARQIQLLGLSGIYSQLLAENIPTLRGLAATYGLSYTPASWLESIQLSKGASSVVNGYESITGQMNLEFKKPNYTEPLFVNFYIDDALHYEGNITSAVQLNPHWWTSLLLSGRINTEVHDENEDTFLDMPKTKYVNVYNRWFYLNPEKGVQSRTGIQFLYESRVAGQDSLCHIQHNIPFTGSPLFETHIENRNLTAYNKTGISIGNKEGQSIGIINSVTHHEQNSDFGRKTFNGTQTSYYANVLFSSFIRSPSHSYTAGVSFTYDNYNTEYADSLSFNYTPLTSFNRSESVPGVFGEYTYSNGNGLTLVLGLRADYNSRFAWLVTPRSSVKYDLNKYITLRASAGRGFRSPNVISENIGLLASSRKLYVDNVSHLDIEKAWNYGASITFYIPIWNGRNATLSLDYFRTTFQNQVIVDTERSRNEVHFYNSNGDKAFANAWQADLSLTIIKGLDLFAAFRYNNNNITYRQDGKLYEAEKPLSPNYRGLLNLSYATNLRRWVFDATVQINGQTRLPGLNGYNSEKIYSPAFPVVFAQITKNSKRFDVYLGVENLLDYKQDDPIKYWNNDYKGLPFMPDFDASVVWGPIVGRKIYAGVRLRIGELK